MDLTILDKNSIKIKGKKSSLVVDPAPKSPKTPADAILLLGPDGAIDRVEGSRLVVNDDGEYEVGGIKITGVSNLDSGIVYNLNIDNTPTILARTSTLEKMTDTANEAQIAILNVDSSLNEAIIAQLEAKVIVLYGEKSIEGLKALGRKDLPSTRKVTIGREKLPEEQETQIVWLD